MAHDSDTSDSEDEQVVKPEPALESAPEVERELEEPPYKFPLRRWQVDSNQNKQYTLGSYEFPAEPLSMPDGHYVPTPEEWRKRRERPPAGADDAVQVGAAIMQFAVKKLQDPNARNQKSQPSKAALKTEFPDHFVGRGFLTADCLVHKLFDPESTKRVSYDKQNPVPWLFYRAWNEADDGTGNRLLDGEKLSILFAENNTANRNAYLRLRGQVNMLPGGKDKTADDTKTTRKRKAVAPPEIQDPEEWAQRQRVLAKENAQHNEQKAKRLAQSFQGANGKDGKLAQSADGPATLGQVAQQAPTASNLVTLLLHGINTSLMTVAQPHTDLQRKVDNIQTVAANSSTRSKDTSAQLEELQKQIGALQSNQRRVEEENNDLKSKLEDQTIKLNEGRAMMEDLRKELHELKAKTNENHESQKSSISGLRRRLDFANSDLVKTLKSKDVIWDAKLDRKLGDLRSGYQEYSDKGTQVNLAHRVQSLEITKEMTTADIPQNQQTQHAVSANTASEQSDIDRGSGGQTQSIEKTSADKITNTESALEHDERKDDERKIEKRKEKEHKEIERKDDEHKEIERKENENKEIERKDEEHKNKTPQDSQPVKVEDNEREFLLHNPWA
ncbi:hypothetical protein KCU78_g11012, partial [Aureobasidium melanogenum]